MGSNNEKKRFLVLNSNDDVMIALEDLSYKDNVNDIDILDNIPAGHKVAIKAKKKGEPILRYGQVIGFATRDIRLGHHVHTHNLGYNEFGKEYRVCEDYRPTQISTDIDSFEGIVRPDGRIATRNYIGILTSVNCAGTVAQAVADRFRRDIHPQVLEAYPNVNGVVALTHYGGCGINPKGEGLAVLQRTITGYAKHPNFAGVLIIGLGCETNQIDNMLRDVDLKETSNLRTFTIQDVGGTRKAVEKGASVVREMLPRADQFMRTAVPVSHLKVGIQCGGSDSYSGVTSNPVLGAAMDKLIKNGGTAILSETPEIYGAEHLLTCRSVNREVAQKLIDAIDWWKDICQRNDASLNNNPSSGNKAGGLTTVLEKALGGVTKGGTTGLMEVYRYAEQICKKGLVFMDTPGNDPMSVTGQVAGGANMVCFTTGRGSAFGCVPVPSLKLSSNTALWFKQRDDIDMNCGTVIDEGADFEKLGARLYELILRCASGEPSKSELNGYGQNEFVPWQPGIIC